MELREGPDLTKSSSHKVHGTTPGLVRRFDSLIRPALPGLQRFPIDRLTRPVRVLVDRDHFAERLLIAAGEIPRDWNADVTK